MSFSHRELLQQAEDLYQAELNRVAQLENQLETANAKIVVLETAVEELKKLLAETEPPPDPVIEYAWFDDFKTAPDDTRYVRAGFDPDANFLLVPGGGMDCVFVTGKIGGSHASGATNKVLRSELLIRKPGTNLHWREEIGGTYLDEFELTIPTSYAPAKANEAVVIYQAWQAQEWKPPIQLQVIDPATTPEPFLVRLVLSSPLGKERRVWSMPLEKGRRYKFGLQTKWSHEADGELDLFVDDAPAYTLSGPTCYDAGQGMAPHLGQYHAGSHDEEAGVSTTIRFHKWSIREL